MADERSMEEVFWSLKLEVLIDLREIIVRDLQPHKYFDYLRSKRVLDKDDCDDIQAERSRKRQAGAFLDILSGKGPEAFDEFCESLRKGKTQIHLLRTLLTAFEEKRNDFLVENSPGNPCSENLPTDISSPDDSVTIDMKSLPQPGDPGGPAIPDDCPKEPSTNIDTSIEKPGKEKEPPNDPPPPYTE